MSVAGADTYETVIGLEVHAQLLTHSKMYCACSAAYADAAPNTHVCPICLGLPGALPVINHAAVEAVLLTGLALGSEIPSFCKLDRKNYVYPDLPKGYQISQYDLPLCVGGTLEFESVGGRRIAGITRVHIEEDTGRLVHRSDPDGNAVSLVDLNRSGVPLMEIVGEPDLRSPEEGRDYLMALRQVLRYIGVSTGNMEDGAFRCDANISTRRLDGSHGGAKVEIKNMNSFRSVERALRFEETRQRTLLDSGDVVVQETRGWSDDRGVTMAQRTKEQAHDYRYFPEPDLPPLTIDTPAVHDLEGKLPELPLARRDRLMSSYGLSVDDATSLTQERDLANAFEDVVSAMASPHSAKPAANWILNDILGLQRQRRLPSEQLPLSVPQIVDLLDAIHGQELTPRAAKELLPHIADGEMPRLAARRLNLLSLTDDGAIEAAIDDAFAAFPEAVADYRSGKGSAIGRLIGETIRLTGGRARPDQVRLRLQQRLDGES